MAVRRWTNDELEKIIEYVNKYPGNYSYAFRELSPVINRSVLAISLKFKEIKGNYETPRVVSPIGIKTPNGISKWTINPPQFEKIKRWNNIKHLFFN